MRKAKYKIEKETYEEQSKAGRYNPGLVITYRNKYGVHRVPIKSGYQDEIEVYNHREYTYILSLNRRLDYVGLEVFKNSELIEDIFLQNDYEIESVFGKKGLNYSNPNIVKILSNYL